MENEAPNYKKEFLRSWFHATLGLITLGAGFASGEPLGLIAGATPYTIGWIYLPDSGFFRNWINRKAEERRKAAELLQAIEFMRKRDSQLSGLTPARRARYNELAQVCLDVEKASTRETHVMPGSEAEPDPTINTRLRKLDELMWTFLRLLSIEQSLELFLETERRDDVPEIAKTTADEVAALTAEIDTLKKAGKATDGRERLLASKQDLLDVMQKRVLRAEQARQNLALVVCEQDRLDQQIKLLRADAIAAKNAGGLSQRIDASVEQLDQTNKWLSQLDEFKDVVGDIPQVQMRIGYGPQNAPPVSQEAAKVQVKTPVRIIRK